MKETKKRWAVILWQPSRYSARNIAQHINTLWPGEFKTAVRRINVEKDKE